MVVAKGGSKLAPFDPEHIPPPPPRNGAKAMMMGAMTMPQFAVQLARPAGRPVVDKTGLAGRFFCTVTFSPLTAEAANAADAPVDIFAALQQQLGLKLEARKESLPVLVIDKVERTPVEN